MEDNLRNKKKQNESNGYDTLMSIKKDEIERSIGWGETKGNHNNRK